MPRDRHSRPQSPASSLGYSPDSRSPSPFSRPPPGSRGRRPSYSRSPTRSRPQSRHNSRRDDSLSSRSSSRSPSRNRDSKRAQLKDLKDKAKDKTTTTSGMKATMVFLGSVAAATYAAHKYWPKGITYGDKEDWEQETKVIKKKAKRIVEGEDPRHFDDRGSPPRRRDDRPRIEEGRPRDYDDRDPPYRRQEERPRIEDDRRLRDYDRDYERPRSTVGKLEYVGTIPRREAELLTAEDAQFLRAPPAGMTRGHTDGVTTMSVASGSREGDVRRARYVEDSLTKRDDGRPYADSRDWRENDRNYDDYRDGPGSRYDERPSGRPRRYSYDEPPDTVRGERVVYTKHREQYR